MFYSQLLLSKKGALGKVWLAAHYDKKLTRQQIQNTSVKSLAANVVKPQAALSLRVSAHLLLGLSKIFQRQVTYLFVESNDALVKIRAAFNTGAGGAAGLIEGGEAAADGAAVAPAKGKKGQKAGKGAAAGADIDAGDEALRGNVDMAAGFLDLESGFGAFGGGDENFAGSIAGEEWAAMGAGSRKASRGGVALDDSGFGLGEGFGDGDQASGYDYEDAHAMAVGGKKGVLGKKGTTNLLMTGGSKSTAGRSSISDVEMLRRGTGAAGSVDGSMASSYLRRGASGGALGSEAGDGSIATEDSYMGLGGAAGKRGLRRVAAGSNRLSEGLGQLGEGEDYLMGMGGGAAGGGMELDADEAAMAAMMEGGSGAAMMGEPQWGQNDGYGGGDDMMMGGGDQNEGYGDYGVGSADQQQQQQPGAGAGAGAGAGFDAALGSYFMSEADIQAAAEKEAERQAQKKAEMQKKRAEKAAERKAKRDAAVAASSTAVGPVVRAAANVGGKAAVAVVDTAVVLKGDTIKTWLSNTQHITRPRRELQIMAPSGNANSNSSYNALSALAERFKQASLRSSEQRANAVVATMNSAGAMGPFSKELADTMATNPNFAAAMRADQVAALPSVTGWDGLVLPPSADPALIAALTTGDATAAAEATSSAHLEERILQPPGAFSTSGVLPGLGLSSLNPEVALLAAGNLHGRVKYPLAEVPLTLQQQQVQQTVEAGEHEGIVVAGKGGADEEPQWGQNDGYGGGDDMMMGGGDQNEGYGDYGVGEEGLLPLDSEQKQLDLASQLLQGEGGAGGLLAQQSPAGLSTSTGASSASSAAANSKLGGVFARESLLASGGGVPASADVSLSMTASGQQQQQMSLSSHHQQQQQQQQQGGGAIESASGKWHSQTRRMLEILASEMTGPVLPSEAEQAKAKVGKKRKAAEMEAAALAAAQPPSYDLSDLQEGKGTSADPVSFLNLAADADASQVAVSFLHLLQLKTWDIIDVQQQTSYHDIGVVRTEKFATALADVRKGLH